MLQDVNCEHWVIQWYDPICPIKMRVDGNVPEPWILSMNESKAVTMHTTTTTTKDTPTHTKKPTYLAL